MRLTFILVVSTIQSIAVQARLRHHRDAQLVNRIEALPDPEPADSNAPASMTPPPSNNVNILDVMNITSSVSSSASGSSASSSSCTPKSICVDGLTCSMRYGGCYDTNFCHGSSWPPYPIPSCDSSPARGLTSNNMDASQQRDDPDIAGEVIVENLMNARLGAD